MLKNSAPSDHHYMQHALLLAKRGLGQTWPNPTVGCVIVQDNLIVGRGWTQPGGRPHAETEAIKQAGKASKGAIAYVTLEPCAHQGKTPPCADALIKAGIARVVVATEDPDPRTSGKGIVRLRDAGIEVTTGVLQHEANTLNAGFFKRVRHNLPWVTLKLATTLDGKIACHNGDSQWITSEAARNYGHLFRAEHDAILVGSGTAIHDTPTLTCRLPGLEHRSPQRVILDRRARVTDICRHSHESGNLPNVKTWIITAAKDHPLATHPHVECLPLSSEASPLKESLQLLADKGITRVLVEGGAGIATGLIEEDLIDEIAWFHAAKIMGNDGLAAVGALNVNSVRALKHYMIVEQMHIGEDSMTILSRHKP